MRQDIYQFDEFQLDTANRELRRDGKRVQLPAKALDLLQTLVENNGRLVGKDEIFNRLWQDQIVEESNLTVHISQIRKALGESKKNPRFIETVPGYGYRFKAEMSNAEEDLILETNTLSRIAIERETEEEISNGTSKFLENQRPKTKDQRAFFLALGVFIVVLALGGFWFFNRTGKNRSGIVPIVSAEKQPKIKRLTNHGRVNTAAISPDGKFFAYSFVERGSYRTELRLGQTDGSSETFLRSLSDVRYYPRMFSADSGWLYYVASELRETKGALYKIPVLGGAAQKLADNVSIWISVSPDEKQIAFIRNNKENKTSALVVANLDGTGEREIVARPLDLSFVEDSQTWSPDGQFIAVGAANGANRKNVSNKHHEVFAVRVSDGGIHQLTALEWNEVDTLEWLKDGSGLMAVARDKDRIVELQLWQIDYPSGKARLFSRDADTHAGELSFSADSNNLLVVQREIETNIWIALTENLKEARQITFSSSGRLDGWFGINWTRDGRIVYTAFIDQSQTIWIMDALGANARQLTSTGFRDERPSVTADGRFIVFQSNRSGKTEIWRMDSDGSNLQQLTFSGGNSTPAPTPDGNWVVFRHNADDGKNSIWRVPLAGGEPVLISDNESYNPRVSPDGKLVACAYEIDGKTKLAVLRIEGGEPIKLFDVPKTRNFRHEIRWTPDGKSITYPDGANGIWQQSIEGGEPQRLAGLPAEMTFSHSWSPDGKYLAFGRVREVRDAVLISDFR